MKFVQKWSLLPLILLVCLLFFGCNKSSNQSAANAAQSATKHYQLKGKVVSIDQRGKMVNIDNEPIPGFMDSMTMPYQVKPESELDRLHPGDKISADLMVQDDNSWLENITVRSGGAPSSK